MAGYTADVFGNMFGIAENAVVYPLKDIFPFAVFNGGFYRIGIIYISCADIGYIGNFSSYTKGGKYFVK